MSYSKKKIQESSENRSGRDFQDWWTERYGVINKKSKAFCSLCSESVVCRTSSVKRHYESNHKWLLSKSEDEQKEYVSHQLKNANLQSYSFEKFVKSTSNLVSASFEVSKIIARHGKPFSDGDYIKESWLECSPYLFEDFQNKDKIIQRIKNLQISRNTVKERIIGMNLNIESQIQVDINLCHAFSICLDESTDVTSCARLAIIARYPKGNEMREELIKLASLSGTTTGAEVCQKVVDELKNANLDVNKIVSVTTDGAPSMTGKDAGFVNLFTRRVGHPLIAFHCIVHQEALCAKSGLKEFEDVMKIVTKIVNFITSRALNKRKFELLLNEVQSVNSGLIKYNNVRWLSRGRVLERFVGCLDEIRMFVDDNKQNYSELTDVDWLCRLMFITDFTQHLNELNTKLQGFGKTIDEALDTISAFEKKLNIFKRDIEKQEFRYFQRLKKFFTEVEVHGTVVKTAQIVLFVETIDATLEQFSTRFVQFRKFEGTTKFMKFADIVEFEKLDLTMFDWMELPEFELQLAELQSSSIWKQKFVDLRVRLEIIERDRCNGLKPHLSAENEVLSVWNDLPETFKSLKNVAVAISCIFSSSYSCESLFSTMNFIKSDIRSRLTDDLSAACIGLKNTKYSPDIKFLSSGIQQQISH